MPYAERTAVPVWRSITELDTMLTKAGATGFAQIRDGDTHAVGFRFKSRMFRFEITRPDPSEHAKTPTGLRRALAEQQRLTEQDEKARWRGLVLVVKALLVAAENGVITMDQAFLPYMVLPNGETMTAWATPRLDEIAAGGNLPALTAGTGG